MNPVGAALSALNGIQTINRLIPQLAASFATVLNLNLATIDAIQAFIINGPLALLNGTIVFFLLPQTALGIALILLAIAPVVNPIMFRVISWGFGILAINSVNFLFVMPTLGLKIVMTYSTGINAILWAINRFFSEISAATGLIFALTFAVFCPALGLAGALLAAPGIINTVAGLLNGALALWNNTWFLLLSGLTFLVGNLALLGLLPVIHHAIWFLGLGFPNILVILGTISAGFHITISAGCALLTAIFAGIALATNFHTVMAILLGSLAVINSGLILLNGGLTLWNNAGFLAFILPTIANAALALIYLGLAAVDSAKAILTPASGITASALAALAVLHAINSALFSVLAAFGGINAFGFTKANIRSALLSLAIFAITALAGLAIKALSSSVGTTLGALGGGISLAALGAGVGATITGALGAAAALAYRYYKTKTTTAPAPHACPEEKGRKQQGQQRW